MPPRKKTAAGLGNRAAGQTTATHTQPNKKSTRSQRSRAGAVESPHANDGSSGGVHGNEIQSGDPDLTDPNMTEEANTANTGASEPINTVDANSSQEPVDSNSPGDAQTYPDTMHNGEVPVLSHSPGHSSTKVQANRPVEVPARDDESLPDAPAVKKPRIVIKESGGRSRKSRSKWDNPEEMLTNPRAPLATAELRVSHTQSESVTMGGYIDSIDPALLRKSMGYT
jgi:hypothetical protein